MSATSASSPSEEPLVVLLLRTRPDGRAHSGTVADWLLGLPGEVRRRALPFDRGVLAALSAPAVGHALAAGHQAALRSLDPSLAPESVAAFCASEEGGAHPRAINTSLSRASGQGLRLTGRKQWATLAPLSTTLLVVASTGRSAARNQLKVVRLPATRAGVTIAAMPGIAETPELPHGLVSLDGVAVAEDEVLPGDGYRDAVKPFRTLEDLYLPAALLGYTLGIGQRFAWPEAEIERHLALIAAGRSLALLLEEARDAGGEAEGAHHDDELETLAVQLSAVHLALAGWLSLVREARAAQAPLWQGVDPELRAGWERDTGRELAARARELRRESAWRGVRARRADEVAD